MSVHPDGSTATRLARPIMRPALLGRLAAPHLAALGVVMLAMVALPSTLVPSYNGTSITNVARFARRHLEHIGEVSGVKNPWHETPDVLGNVVAGWSVFVLYFVIASVGVVLAVTINRRRDAHFACYVAVALLIGGSFRTPINRYVASIGPLLVLLGAVALTSRASRISPPRLRSVMVSLPLLALVAGNLGHALDRIDASNTFEAAGRVEWGPSHPDAVAMYDQVVARTDPDSVVGAPKARAMTWATGRRAVQVGGPWRVPSSVAIDLIVLELDDPLRSELEAAEHWERAWAGRRFVLYEPADPSG
jgi:hypothetical protein